MNHADRNHGFETYLQLKKEMESRFEKMNWIDALKGGVVAVAPTILIQATISPFIWAFFGINIGLASDCMTPAGTKVPDMSLFISADDILGNCTTQFKPIRFLLVTAFLFWIFAPIFYRWYRARRWRKLWVG